MNLLSPLTKTSKHDLNNKIKVIKFESSPSQQLKRRRSRSHNAMQYSDGTLFNGDISNRPYSYQNDDFSEDSIKFSQRSSYVNNQWIKEKHKKDTHNRVERKRRDFINEQIQKLADLLPSELFLNCDLKMNKGVILKSSVEYISSMKCVQEMNEQLVHENELGSRVIRILVALKDSDYSAISNGEDLNDKQSSHGIDINNLINAWQNVHQENKEMLDKFSNRLSNTFSEKKSEINFEDMFNLDATNNNSVGVPVASRKRYSSMPTNISYHSNGSRSIAPVNIIDKDTPILNSLLKKPEVYHSIVNEPSQSTFSMENIDDSINYYLQCTNSNLESDETALENSIVEEPVRTIPGRNEKVHYVLPKASNRNCCDLLNDQIESHLIKSNSNNHDPMLLSVNVNFESGDR